MHYSILKTDLHLVTTDVLHIIFPKWSPPVALREMLTGYIDQMFLLKAS